MKRKGKKMQGFMGVNKVKWRLEPTMFPSQGN
jgi:hypothetical protein